MSSSVYLEDTATDAARPRKARFLCFGVDRLPVTPYKGQWLRLLAGAAEIEAFLRENQSKLKTKGIEQEAVANDGKFVSLTNEVVREQLEKVGVEGLYMRWHAPPCRCRSTQIQSMPLMSAPHFASIINDESCSLRIMYLTIG